MTAQQGITNYLSYGIGAPSGAPSVPAGSYAFYQDTVTGNVYVWNLATSTWNAMSVASIAYPKRAVLWHDEALITVGNVMLIQHDTAENYATVSLQNPSANGDTFTQSFALTAGTYTLAVMGYTANAEGKLDWYMDGVLAISAQDWYSASTVKNVVKTGSITVATSGYHVLRGVVNGKNASSAAYNIQLTKYWLYPSAD